MYNLKYNLIILGVFMGNKKTKITNIVGYIFLGALNVFYGYLFINYYKSINTENALGAAIVTVVFIPILIIILIAFAIYILVVTIISIKKHCFWYAFANIILYLLIITQLVLFITIV